MTKQQDMTLEEADQIMKRYYVSLLVEQMNEQVGNLDGCDCAKCKNRGYYYVNRGDWAEKVVCGCMKNRKVLSLAQHSGLGALLETCKFENFRDFGEAWLKNIYTRAQEFLSDNKPFFFMGGQVGAGKSFVCTSMVNEYIRREMDCKFVMWSELATMLKQNVMNDANKYNEIMTEIQNATVLYIDDFFNTTPTVADIDKAFQIINFRYNQARIKPKRYITLISSERMLPEIKQVHEGIATRIGELATPRYTLNINRVKGRNIRERIMREATLSSEI